MLLESLCPGWTQSSWDVRSLSQGQHLSDPHLKSHIVIGCRASVEFTHFTHSHLLLVLSYFLKENCILLFPRIMYNSFHDFGWSIFRIPCPFLLFIYLLLLLLNKQAARPFQNQKSIFHRDMQKLFRIFFEVHIGKWGVNQFSCNWRLVLTSSKLKSKLRPFLTEHF